MADRTRTGVPHGCSVRRGIQPDDWLRSASSSIVTSQRQNTHTQQRGTGSRWLEATGRSGLGSFMRRTPPGCCGELALVGVQRWRRWRRRQEAVAAASDSSLQETLPFLAFLPPFCQRLMPLLVVLQCDGPAARRHS